jgi:SAM-dependent methyltransferase
LFSQTADLYDLIYSWKDYQGETDRLRRLAGREGGSLLDVACGTGRHLELLAPHYRCEGVELDPAMAAIARRRGLTVHHGDLSTFDLGRVFDVVTCLFSSIGYAKELEPAVHNLARHVAAGGLLVVEPWLAPDQPDPRRVGLRTAESQGVTVARMNDMAVRGRASVMHFHYLVGRDGVVQHLTERHELWLWTRDEYAAAFTGAGLAPTYDEEGLMGRGLWLGVAGR